MRRTAIALTLIVPLVIGALATASAQPPAHAPAHGYRAKHHTKARYVGRTGHRWERDYGIQSGTCDHRAIATALGAMAGAAIANRVADEENRAVATLIGAAAGAFIGNRIGRTIDKADEACIGHALELGAPGQPVSWTNAVNGAGYRVIPGPDRKQNGATCREFTLLAVTGSAKSERKGIGCEFQPGVWRIVQ